MRLTKAVIGRVVEVTWRDPIGGRVTSKDLLHHSDVPKGWAALARWREYGVIDDMTDGIVRLVRGFGTDNHVTDESPVDEYDATWIPESLIETVKVYAAPEPVKEEGKA